MGGSRTKRSSIRLIRPMGKSTSESGNVFYKGRCDGSAGLPQ